MSDLHCKLMDLAGEAAGAILDLALAAFDEAFTVKADDDDESLGFFVFPADAPPEGERDVNHAVKVEFETRRRGTVLMPLAARIYIGNDTKPIATNCYSDEPLSEAIKLALTELRGHPPKLAA